MAPKDSYTVPGNNFTLKRYWKSDRIRISHVVFATALLFALPLDAESVRVATLNLRNYLSMDRMVEGVFRRNYPKGELQKAALRAVVKSVNPDILAVQEIGTEQYLLEFQRDLANCGIDYPHTVLLQAVDPDRHLAILSKIPPVELLQITSLDFKYFDNRESIKRGVLGAVFQTDGFTWTLFNIHLKSQWTVRTDDQNSRLRRLREAEAFRNYIKKRYSSGDGGLYLVVGDLNSNLNDKPLQRLLKIGSRVLTEVVPATDSRGESWTYFYAKAGVYSLFDYILSSPALMPHVIGGRGTIVDHNEMLIGTDHRMVYVDLEFEAGP